MRRLVVALAFCLLGLAAAPLVGPFVVQAQEAAPVDYDQWEGIASEAEATLEDGDPTQAELDQLRADLVSWRSKFSDAQATNASRIATLREQISALGPAPAEGEEEPAEIATRRAELQNTLARLEAPRLKAEEAYSRADGLVKEIDATARERQTRRLLTLGPSPLNPEHWAAAVKDLGGSLSAVHTEVVTIWSDPEQRQRFRENLLPTSFFLLVALILLLRGRHWMERLTRYVQRKPKESQHSGVRGFLVSLGQVILPVLGIVMLVAALSYSELLGPRGDILLQNLPLLGLSFFGSRWLTLRLFPDDPNRSAMLNLEPSKRAEMRFYGSLLGLLFGISLLLAGLAEYEDYPLATRAVLIFPVLVVAGLILFRLG